MLTQILLIGLLMTFLQTVAITLGVMVTIAVVIGLTFLFYRVVDYITDDIKKLLGKR